ncbi:hypothetical protein PORY_000995, partial [Pneumocystis oryctolagi]
TTAPPSLQSRQGYSFPYEHYQNTQRYSSYQGYGASSSVQTGASVTSYYDNVNNISEHSVNPNHSSNQSLQTPLTQGSSSATTNTRSCSLPVTQVKTETNTSHVQAKLSKKESITPAMPLPTRLKNSAVHQENAKKNEVLSHKNTTSSADSPKTQFASTVSTMNNEVFSDIQNLTGRMSKLSTESRNTQLQNSGNHLAHHRYGKRRDNGHINVRNTSRTINIPKEEFDFTHWNSKFNKEELMKSSNTKETDESNNPIMPRKESYYDSKTSFFDNISCENKERIENKEKENSRARRDQERNQNMETFGQFQLPGAKKYGKGHGKGRGGFRRGYQNSRNRNTRRNQSAMNGELA